ncbi:hypothetical protein Btru_046508 [Bulinus truncatus]|nr:hypothetical protein Btru_046508 [Bulinus truncatus]
MDGKSSLEGVSETTVGFWEGEVGGMGRWRSAKERWYGWVVGRVIGVWKERMDRRNAQTDATHWSGNFVRVVKAPNTLGPASRVVVEYHCESDGIIVADVTVMAANTDQQTTIFSKAWKCKGQGFEGKPKTKVLKLRLPDSLVFRPDYFNKGFPLWLMGWSKLRVWLIDSTEGYRLNESDLSGMAKNRDFYKMKVLPPYSRPYKHPRCTSWIWPVLQTLHSLSDVQMCTVEKERVVMLNYPAVFNGNTYSILKQLTPYSDPDLERDRQEKLFAPELTIELWVYIIEYCPLHHLNRAEACGLFLHMDSQGIMCTPSLMVNRYGNIQVDVKAASGSIGLKTFETIPTNVWTRIIFTLNHRKWMLYVNYGPNLQNGFSTSYTYNEDMYVDDTFGLMSIGGIDWSMGSFVGYMGRVVYYRRRALEPHQVTLPDIYHPMFELHLTQKREKCETFLNWLDTAVDVYQTYRRYSVNQRPDVCPNNVYHYFTNFLLGKVDRWKCPMKHPFHRRHHREISHWLKKVVNTMDLSRNFLHGDVSAYTRHFKTEDSRHAFLNISVGLIEKANQIVSDRGLRHASKVVHLLKQAACLGNNDAMYYMAVMMNNGVGCAINELQVMINDNHKVMINDNHKLMINDNHKLMINDNHKAMINDNHKVMINDNHKVMINDNHKVMINDNHKVMINDNHKLMINDNHKLMINDNHKLMINDNHKVMINDNHKLMINDNHKLMINDNHKLMINDNHKAMINDNHKVMINDNHKLMINDNHKLMINDNHKFMINDNHKVMINDNHKAMINDNHKVMINDNHKLMINDNHKLMINDNHKVMINDNHKVMINDNHKSLAYFMLGTLNNHVFSIMALGHRHLMGVDGAPLDKEIAYMYYKQVADRTRKDKEEHKESDVATEYIRLIDEAKIDGLTSEIGDLFMWLKHQAEKGVASAQSELGYMLYHGAQGVKRNLHNAMNVFREGAQAGNEYAMVNYGLMQYRGLGTEANKTEGKIMLEKAAQQMNPAAVSALGWLALSTDQNYTEAFKLFQVAKSLGNMDSGYYLGHMYQFGLVPGSPVDLDKAIVEYQWSAIRNQVDAGAIYAFLLSRGTPSVPRDISMATDWARFVAEKNSLLGRPLRDAVLAFRDSNYDLSVFLYLMLADVGLEVASFNLAYLCEQNHGGVTSFISKECEFRHYNLTVQREGHFVDSYSYLKMGDYSWYGCNNTRDISAAAVYYTKAAQKGNPQALFNLAYMVEYNVSLNENIWTHLGISSTIYNNKVSLLLELYSRCKESRQSEAFVPCCLAWFRIWFLDAWETYDLYIKLTSSLGVVLTILAAIFAIHSNIQQKRRLEQDEAQRREDEEAERRMPEEAQII